MERARAVRYWCATLALAALAAAGPRYSSRIVDTESGAIRGVIVEPASRRLEPVEVFRGVPYAAPPRRLAPPPPPPRWSGTRLADAFAPVCPQRYPDISNKTAALTRMPLGRYKELKLLVPLLANQSEDCLYLNIYVPGSGARGVEAPYAVLVWLGGGSFEWGTANALDGSVLAARAHLVVVTVNYRLGLLGFLTPGEEARGAEAAVRAAGSAAALDAVAALRWVRRNVASFGGDPRRVALAGHDTAAALATVLLMMPQVKGLFSRALLMSGTALSSWALAPEPALLRSSTAQQLHCTPDAGAAATGSPATAPAASPAPTAAGADGEEGWLARCVRARPLAALLAVTAPRARFLAGWAPSVPAAAPAAAASPSAPAPAAPAPQPPARALDTSEAFLACALAIGVATTESYQDFADDDVQYGFEEDYRNRVLRTYVRNVYQYHRNEIFAAARNEYTDWDKPIQHPINIRDATLEALSDAATAAPALRAAHLHARRGADTHFFHFAYQTKDSDFPQRLGSVRGEALPYLLGLPLVGGLPLAPHNYSRGDVAVAESVLALVAAFVKSGQPTPPAGDAYAGPAWPRYELGTQQYLSINSKPRVKSHYRGHKMALWLHLVPQLHRPGAAAPRHHHFRERDPDMYSGAIFPERYTVTSQLGGDEEFDGDEDEEEVEGGAGGEECDSPPPSPRPALPAQPAPPRPTGGEADLLKTFTDTHYYSYTLALGVTVAVGCFLLALNVLIFAGIYYQRGRGKQRRRQRHSLHREGSIQVSKGLEAGSGSGSICHIKPMRTNTLPRQRSIESDVTDERPLHSSGAATLPVKKRVQIQEISV